MHKIFEIDKDGFLRFGKTDLEKMLDEAEKEIVAVSYDEDCIKEYATLHNRLDGVGWFCRVKFVDVLTKNCGTQ